MALTQFEMDELRLKAERERINATGGLALADLQAQNDQLAQSMAPLSFVATPQPENSRMTQARQGFQVVPNTEKVFQPNVAFTKGENPQVPIRTGPNTAYLPGGTLESGDRKLFIAPDGTMTNFPTDRDISQHAIKVPAPTTADYAQNLERNLVSETVRAPSPFPKTKDDWERLKLESASRGIDFATTRLGERGQRIALKQSERAALAAGIISSYDVAPQLNILAGESSPDTKALLSSQMGATYTNNLIRAQQEFDTKIAPQLATVKSIEDINKLVRGMDTFDPKLASQFKVMAERGLARSNPEAYAELQRTAALSTANNAALASFGDARGSAIKGYPAQGSERDKAEFVKQNPELSRAYSEETGGIKVITDPVTMKPMAIYDLNSPSGEDLSLSEREREIYGVKKATLESEIKSLQLHKDPSARALASGKQAELNQVYAAITKERQETKAAMGLAPASLLAESVQDGTQKDKQVLAMREWEANSEIKDKPYIHVGAVVGQEAGRDVLPEGTIDKGGGEGEILKESIGVKTLAPEIATEMASRIASDPTKIGSVLSDSTKAVLLRHKGAVKIFGDNADDYVGKLTQAAKDAFKERADKVFENVDARKMAAKRAELDAFVVGAPIKQSESVVRFKAVQGKILSNDQQFILDNNIGGDTKALDTPEDYVMADIAMNYPGIKDLAKEILKGNANIAGAQRVKDIVMENRERFNTQLLADTAAKTAEENAGLVEAWKTVPASIANVLKSSALDVTQLSAEARNEKFVSEGTPQVNLRNPTANLLERGGNKYWYATESMKVLADSLDDEGLAAFNNTIGRRDGFIGWNNDVNTRRGIVSAMSGMTQDLTKGKDSLYSDEWAAEKNAADIANEVAADKVKQGGKDVKTTKFVYPKGLEDIYANDPKLKALRDFGALRRASREDTSGRLIDLADVMATEKYRAMESAVIDAGVQEIRRNMFLKTSSDIAYKLADAYEGLDLADPGMPGYGKVKDLEDVVSRVSRMVYKDEFTSDQLVELRDQYELQSKIASKSKGDRARQKLNFGGPIDNKTLEGYERMADEIVKAINDKLGIAPSLREQVGLANVPAAAIGGFVAGTLPYTVGKLATTPFDVVEDLARIAGEKSAKLGAESSKTGAK